MKKEAYLIVGNTGYVGHLLTYYLQSQGHETITCGRSDADIQLNLSRVKDLPELSKVSNLDLTCIFAAAPNEVLCRESPQEAINITQDGIQKFAEMCFSSSIKKFVYISTFHVFGSNKGRIDEDTTPRPNSLYGSLHLETERYLESLSKCSKTELQIIRLSNLISPPRKLEPLIDGR